MKKSRDRSALLLLRSWRLVAGALVVSGIRWFFVGQLQKIEQLLQSLDVCGPCMGSLQFFATCVQRHHRFLLPAGPKQFNHGALVHSRRRDFSRPASVILLLVR